MVDKNLKSRKAISDEHVENNKAVRNILLDRGVKPENLPALEDAKKVQRRLETEEKKVSKTTKKIK